MGREQQVQVFFIILFHVRPCIVNFADDRNIKFLKRKNVVYASFCSHPLPQALNYDQITIKTPNPKCRLY
jgi:hypothetical protein